MLRGNTLIREVNNMDAENTLLKYGYCRDENNLQLKTVLRNNVKLKELCVDIYPENPSVSTHPALFMLLLRTFEKNAHVSNDNNRLILKRNDKNRTHIMNILFSKIKWCFFKLSESYSEFVFNVQNTYYKLVVIN